MTTVLKAYDCIKIGRTLFYDALDIGVRIDW